MQAKLGLPISFLYAASKKFKRIYDAELINAYIMEKANDEKEFMDEKRYDYIINNHDKIGNYIKDNNKINKYNGGK